MQTSNAVKMGLLALSNDFFKAKNEPQGGRGASGWVVMREESLA
jgi:hypothetical protein